MTTEPKTQGPLSPEMLQKMDAYWRACNYLAAAQLYLFDNPLLKKPLTLEHIKPNVVGHWGTVPGQNFIYTHLNRIIKEHDLNMLYISGPGHGGNAMVAQTWLEGSYTEVYPDITQDEAGMKKLFKQFSFPGGISSHVAPETPGSINEGGELGYSLAHAFGAVLDNPDLIAATVVGDGEAETGPLATAWHGNKIINPATDGTVLPILHLNGYKIANPTIMARIPKEELTAFFKGCGWNPYFVEGSEPADMHQKMAAALEAAVADIKAIKAAAAKGDAERPVWPMLVLRTPKGWTGPKEVEGKIIEGTFRAHQVPIVVSKDKPENVALLEQWLKSYHPEELFDDNGRLRPDLQELAPTGVRRMGSNPVTNGGVVHDLRLPDFRDYAVQFEVPGSVMAQDMLVLGGFVRDIVRDNAERRNFRIFGPDETMSNRLGAVFELTNRQWDADLMVKDDEFLAADGRVIDSMLSEHMCQGMLEGYLLTGRHGFFNSYEAFIRIVDSMAS
ncbi:MAG: phosphoketolase family protein, partial [Clostridium sp.]|nr:phosphoketolase family protein [Clostridium sp.]